MIIGKEKWSFKVLNNILSHSHILDDHVKAKQILKKIEFPSTNVFRDINLLVRSDLELNKSH